MPKSASQFDVMNICYTVQRRFMGDLMVSADCTVNTIVQSPSKRKK